MAALILAPYAAILAVLYLWLSARIPGFRRRHQMGLGVNNDDQFLRAVRAQANFGEYVPFAFVLLYLLAALDAPGLLLHLLGILLVAGRFLHAYSLLVDEAKTGRYRFRIAGMICTFTLLGVSALALLILWFQFHLS